MTARVAPARAVDVLIVSLGATGGLRAADLELAESLGRAGASVEMALADAPRELRTLALTDLAWALAARRAAAEAIARRRPRAIVYSSITAALLWPRPGAIRFDAPAAGNRPGRHGVWQRPLERARLDAAPLLLPWSAGALDELPASGRDPSRTVVLPVSVEIPPRGGDDERDIAAVTYGANPHKKGLDRVLAAWVAARRPGEELLVAGVDADMLRQSGVRLPADGVKVCGMVARERYLQLLRRARVFVCGARREDYGLAQLEALAAGCLLVTTPAPGPYAALALARELDPRLVGDDLTGQLRTALADHAEGYSERARAALAPFTRACVDETVAQQLLPRLLA
jgi:glycosyltransferase involved in cell wall biosynthesis